MMAWVPAFPFITWRLQTLYGKKNLRFDFQNLTSAFEGMDGNDKISISNVMATVSCHSSGNLFGTQVNVSIFGLGMDLLAALSSRAMGTYGSNTESVSLSIFVDDVAIFVGKLTSSIANMNAAPNSALMITATANADLQDKVAQPFSFSGPTSAEEIINAICKPVGYSPMIVGLRGKAVTNPHYEGSVFEQLEKLCYEMQISMSVTPPKISFWDSNKKRDDIVPLVSSQNGLIGYPVFSNGGVMFQTQFSPLLTTGRNIRLETSLPHASGEYSLGSVTHELSSWVSGGPWHSVCIANRPIESANNA